MKKNYIILAHKNPKQVCRLINRLADDESKFFVHVDLKIDLKDFKILESCKNTTIIKERENCIWGDYSIVKATLHLLKNAVEFGNKGFTILLSGQDYPIKSNKIINQFLTDYRDYNFIDILPIADKWSQKMVRDKVENYHFIHSENKSDSNSYAPFFHSTIKDKARTLFHLLKGRMKQETFRKLLHLPKRIPLFKNQYGGSQWWAFNEISTKILYDFVLENYEELESYYQYTSAPDEIFFQSVLMNLISANASIKIKPSLTYVNWVRKNVALPVTFNINDFGELSETENLWARKFDVNYDGEILDLIDCKLL